MRQCLYREDGRAKVAIGHPREIARQQEIYDLTLTIAQDAVADRNPFEDQKNRVAPPAFADDFLAGAESAGAGRKVEQVDSCAGDRWQARNRPLVDARLLPRQCGWVCRHLFPPFMLFL